MLYDFEGDCPSGELVVYTDEILTVTRTVSAVICRACLYFFSLYPLSNFCLVVCLFIFFLFFLPGCWRWLVGRD